MRAHIDQMRRIEAHENVLWALRLMFAHPARTEAEIEYRSSLLDQWIATANGQEAATVDRGDYYRVGNTVYVRTAEAMRSAFGDVAQTKRDRQRLRITD